MKQAPLKGSLALLGLLASSPIYAQINNALQERLSSLFSFDTLEAIFASPTFQLSLIIVISIIGGVWMLYIVSSLQLEQKSPSSSPRTLSPDQKWSIDHVARPFLTPGLQLVPTENEAEKPESERGENTNATRE